MYKMIVYGKNNYQYLCWQCSFRLVNILYNDKYFSLKKDAKVYVDKIYEFIYNIPNLPFNETNNKIFGEFCCKYKDSKNNIWYAYFNYENETYLIKNIANNYSK